MTDHPFDPSPQLEAFLAAEIRNERDGGDSPATLGTALGSLLQMPDDVLADLNQDISAMGIHCNGLIAELRRLIAVFGRDFEFGPQIPDAVLAQKPR